MTIVKLDKTQYSKGQYDRVIDNTFTQLVDPAQLITQANNNNDLGVRLTNFFNDYRSLFFDIPQFGEINSHEYLIKESSAYIDFTDQNIAELLTEIDALRQEILSLTEENIKLQTNNIPQI